MSRLEIQGWFFVPHSYAVINQFQCLEMARRPGLELCFRALPYANPAWRPVRGLMSEDSEKTLASLPDATGEHADAVLRMAHPFDFQRSGSRRTSVFATSEFGVVPRAETVGQKPLVEALAGQDVNIVTPSEWSRNGLLASGAHPEQVHVIPHGIDPRIFKPASKARRDRLRKALGWENSFVFLNISAMTPNKGIQDALAALLPVARKYPQARLALKGLDALFMSNRHFMAVAQQFNGADLALLKKHIGYIGQTRTFARMAELYQAADAYLSPYHAEGFNLPVLEAMACGLPVICTRGGPTDEFTDPECALAIDSRRQPGTCASGETGTLLMPDREHLVSLMEKVIEDDAWREKAGGAGVRQVSSRYTWEHVIDALLPVVLGSQGQG